MRKLVLDASLLRSFEKLLSRRQYVAVHAVEEAAWLASVLCPLHAVRFVYDMASAIPQQLTGHWLLGREPFLSILRSTEKRVIERAAHVVCSGGLAGYVRSQAPEAAVTEWRFPVSGEAAHPSKSAALREQQGIAPEDHMLLYAGNFSAYQGIELLLESFVKASASNPRLLLVCVGATDQQDAERLAARLPEPLRERLRVLSRQPRALMPAWLAAADCLVSLRTQGDNVPLKLFEYMAAGKPIIATTGPAHQPLLNEARAYLCAADIDGVAQAMHEVFEDPERARRLAARAGAYAERHFSWSRFRELVAGIYAEVLQPTALPEPAPARRAR
jgi:glycosyltransferase involved in cell wall biosynthesis